MPLTPFACTHCGFWQRWWAPDPPPSCPVCTDVRNAMPPRAFEFVAPEELEDAGVETTWREVLPGVTGFACEPQVGLGSVGWVIETGRGLVGFEGAPWYSEAALEELERRGGLVALAASHPHGYGALWQLQDRFPDVELVTDVLDLPWTKAFAVTWPADERFELAPGLVLHRTGGHFAGHGVLHDEHREALFCGDALKADAGPDGTVSALSAHKAFHTRIPLSHGELRRYREVLGALSFTSVLTPFEHVPGVTTEDVRALYSRLLAGRPHVDPIPVEELRRAHVA